MMPIASSQKSDSKNLPQFHWSHQRGLNSERATIGYFEKLGARLVDQRFETPFGEIDLAFLDGETLLLVEVKSVGDLGFAEARVGQGQRRRLRNVVEFFLGYVTEVELRLALVDTRNNVQIFDEF